MGTGAQQSGRECPTGAELAAFRSGQISERRIETIGAHLHDCTRCIAKIDSWELRASSRNQLRTLAVSDIDDFDRVLHESGFQRFAAQARNLPGDWSPQSQCIAFQESSPDHLETLHDPTLPAGYEVLQPLGRGGFAEVFLARHSETQRQFAIKVPRADRATSRTEVEQFLNEARTVSELSHPSIVSVIDFGSVGSSCFLVMDYIEGVTLARCLADGDHSRTGNISALATVAGALHHAHTAGFVHRDIKPSNILIDSNGDPFVADFGLAVRDNSQWLHRGEVAGTIPYMAPEQLRGEAHRLDGRTDIWSVGVILYEALCGRLPFQGSQDELTDGILYRDPKPLRQIDDTITLELERICLKCLSKKMVDRYSTARDLSDDLQVARVTAINDDSVNASQPQVIPRGVRAFGSDDADFFLELIPGPRDVRGLPAALCFWKNWVECTESNPGAAVGVIYGPSGCGKSSFVRAGLMPRLADHVLPIYVEATGTDTDLRISAQLGHQGVSLSNGESLDTVIANLRGGESLPDRYTKLLIVIDQFEQWLHIRRDYGKSVLLRALRHCDGSRVQSLLLVRSDFWMGITRFMRELEAPILESTNATTVALFDHRHAIDVLTQFGRAYGALPVLPTPLTQEQTEFVSEAISQLSESGNVICVRLALFAEVVRNKPWTPQTLRDLRGLSGIGVTFLEQTFCAPSAPLLYRRHEESIRAVLTLLLPESGMTIKGQRRSRSEIMGCLDDDCRLEVFAQTMSILDAETRLVTAIDPESSANRDTDEPYYQLTHDYLVTPLRDWLTARQKETRRGRAQLRLEELTRFWNAKPENGRLPGLWDLATISLLTIRSCWTAPQRRMMNAAIWSRGCATLVSLMIAGVAATVGNLYLTSQRVENDQKRADITVRSLLSAPPEAVPYQIGHVIELKQHAVPILQQTFRGETGPNRLRAAVALAEFGLCDSDYLLEQIPDSPPRECSNIAHALASLDGTAVKRLQESFHAAGLKRDWQTQSRLGVLAWNLGDTSLIQDMLHFRPDPQRRAILINTMQSWHGNLANLISDLQSIRDHALRSGICLGIGNISRHDLPMNIVDQWTRLFLTWYLECSDTVTHSSAGWALRKWGVSLPTIGQQNRLEHSSAQWFVNTLGMTMLLMPSGSFVRNIQPGESTDGQQTGAVIHQTVTLSRAYWLCDREVSWSQFQQFMDDTAETDKPSDWQGVKETRSPTTAHPVQQVSWLDAILFCNWLSRREQLTPCYRNRNSIWKVDDQADGYRLPSEAEWEFACRAGTKTAFASGSDETLLANYAVFLQNQTNICGNRMPNAWGLFDMHGNVYEWCYDWHAEFGSERILHDPTGPARGTTRVLRGGAFDYGADLSRADYRARNIQRYRSYTIGFRVVCGVSSHEAVATHK